MKKGKDIKEKSPWQWKTMEYLAYLLVFIAPLYFSSDSLFVFNPGKLFITIFVTLLMVILYSWGKLIERKPSFRFTPLHIITLIFLSILTLSSILGIDPFNSFFGRWREGISLVLIYILTIFAFLVGFLIKENKVFLSRILLASFLSSFFVALVSYAGSSLSEIFKDGGTTIGNSSYAGAYLLFNVCFGVGLFFYYSKIWQKILIALGTFFIAISPIFFNKDILLGKVGLADIIHNPVLLFGYANAATVGLGVSVLVILIFFLIFSSKKVIKIIGLALLASLLIGIFYTGFQLVNPSSSLHRVFVESKGENRFIAWNIAEAGFSSHPILGSGFNNFSYDYQKYFSPDILKEKTPELYFLQPHNVILEYASNNGVLGLLSYFALLSFMFFSFFLMREGESKKEKNIKIALIGLLFGYFTQNLFGFDTPVTYLMLFLVLGFAIGEGKKEWVLFISDKQGNWVKLILSLIIISGLASVVVFVILPQNEIAMWNKAAVTDSTKERVLLRNKMQGISLFGGIHDSVNMAAESLNLYERNLNEINDSNRNLYIDEVQSAVDQLEKDIKNQPYEVRAYITASQLLNLEIYIKGKMDDNLWNQSYNNVKKALELNPKNPEIYSLLAQTYMLKQDFKNAYLSMRQAIMIAPNYVKSYDYAKKLLAIKPDKNFQKYVDMMESKWINISVITN